MEKRHLTSAEISARTNIAKQRIDAIIKGQEKASRTELELLSEALAVPLIVLRSGRDLNLAELPDFRLKQPGLRALSPGTLKSVAFAEQIAALSELG